MPLFRYVINIKMIFLYACIVVVLSKERKKSCMSGENMGEGNS